MITTADRVDPNQMHPALEAMLPLLHPGAQQQLARLLRPLLATAWPNVAWRWSRLTPTWFPVELSVAAGSTTSRYVCEAGPPELPAGERLAYALQLLREENCLPGDVPELLAAALGRHRRRCDADRELGRASLHWGAWIGGRHDDDGDRFKVYAEVPAPDRPQVVAEAGRWLGVDGLPGAPTMVGVDLQGGRAEWYLEPGRIDRDDVGRVAGAATLAVLDELAGRAWYPTDTAFSVAGRQGEPPVTTVIVGANRLLGRDDAVRSRLHQVAARHGLEWGVYDALLAASAARSAHCLLAVSAEPAPVLCIGLSPA